MHAITNPITEHSRCHQPTTSLSLSEPRQKARHLTLGRDMRQGEWAPRSCARVDLAEALLGSTGWAELPPRPRARLARAHARMLARLKARDNICARARRVIFLISCLQPLRSRLVISYRRISVSLTCMKLSEIKLGIITLIISEYMVAV